MYFNTKSYLKNTYNHIIKHTLTIDVFFVLIRGCFLKNMQETKGQSPSLIHHPNNKRFDFWVKFFS